MAVVISSIEKNSPAEKAGILKGESLVSINGNAIKDVLDYRFYMTDRNLDIELLKDGKTRTVSVSKPEYEDLGLDFETYLMDKEHCCKNKCIFCFIDQMPPNMRETLYFKDDDSRLGFLFGNYVTLTNLEEEDIDRIIKMRLSPINVSVHTMNPKLRVEMMKNPNAADSLDYLKKMADAGITLHLQFVLCPGINDGEELRYSFREVEKLGPAVESAVCVPVGLTKCRQNLPKLKPFDKEGSLEVIKIVDEFRAECMEKYGEPVFYAADEFFIKAELPFPEYEYYGDFTQLEDGVGLCALLKHDFYEALDYFPAGEYNRRVTIPTGKAAYSTIKELADAAESRYKGLKIEVLAMENEFFGELITVTGLLTGGDIVKQLKEKDNGDAVLICESTLRYEHDKFIDDTTPQWVEQQLGVPVTMVPNDGYKLLCAMLGEEAEDECEVIYG
ncbi:MAG: DUF512 domain-containing protein [Oscillospiraceae bacterium]|nr:DUF512 domain-containing protein [Oscillospiraceae bacterium]